MWDLDWSVKKLKMKAPKKLTKKQQKELDQASLYKYIYIYIDIDNGITIRNIYIDIDNGITIRNIYIDIVIEITIRNIYLSCWWVIY